MAVDANGNLVRDPYFGMEPSTTNEIYDPQNINISRVEIEHSKGILQLAGGLHSFQIMYSMLSPCSKCIISILDTTEVLANLDIDGTEILRIQFNSADDSEIIAEFNIYKVEIDIDKNSGAAGKGYHLFGIDPTFMRQLKMDINRSFEGKIDEMVESVFNEIGIAQFQSIENKLWTIHETTGSLKLIVPGETPFESIRKFERYAYSSKYSSSLFYFYQDSIGYNWCNAEQLIEGPRDSRFIHQYVYNPKGAGTELNLEAKFTIAEIDFPQGKNMIDKIVSGAYANRVNEIDLVNQKINTTELVVKDNFNDFHHLDKPAITLDKIEAIDRHLNVINNSTWLKKYPNNFNWGPNLTRAEFYADSLNQVKMNCVVPGYSNLDPGMIFDLSMLELSANKENPEQEKKISGKWLIDTVVHHYKGGRYTCSLACAKESHRANVDDLTQYIIGDRK